jgi:predicted NAD/FAD-binding protein
VPNRIHLQSTFATPHFTHRSVRARARHAEISGPKRLHFCGTSWANGIHEGALRSALQVAQWFGRDLNRVIDGA